MRMESFSAASAKRALGGLESLRWTGDSAGFSNVRTLYAGRTGICGNGLCEVRPGSPAKPLATHISRHLLPIARVERFVILQLSACHKPHAVTAEAYVDLLI